MAPILKVIELMCHHLKRTSAEEALKKRFKATLNGKIKPVSELNGFDNPVLPVITNENPDEIQLFHWGLIPSWTNIMDTRKKTLNARLETLDKQLSFKESISRRCLVLVNGFYEHQWLDPKGRLKQKYLLGLPKDQPFALAGLWRAGIAPNGEFMQTFTIITTEAQGIMRDIHNNGLRMPLILPPNEERAWLLSEAEATPFHKLTPKMVGPDKRMGQLALF
jgi:putative SOS response-associated peptidase YedK